jgi:hypothetical protein
MERSDLPIGVAAVAQNVEFFPGGFRTRDGFKPYLYEPAATVGDFLAIFDHVDGKGVRHHVTYQGEVGKIGERNTGTTINTVVTKIGSMTNTFSTMKAASLYGKLYACISDGRRGIAPPIQWDGTLDATSVAATGADAATLGEVAGVMVGGTYYVVVAFETATEYITGTTKLNYITIASNKSIQVTSVPLGPPGTVKRRIFVSLVDSFELFNPPSLVINDNTTTTAAINLTQADIAGGLPFEGFQSLQIPTSHLGVESYANRLVMWGGDGKINPFFGPLTTAIDSTYSSIGLINLDFGARNAAYYNWAVAGTYADWYGTSGNAAVIAGSKNEGEVLNYLRLTSLGAGLTPKIQQGYGSVDTRLNKDALGNYYLAPGRRYGIRARIRVEGSNSNAGSVVIRLYETASLASRTQVAELNIAVDDLNGNKWWVYEADGTVTTTGTPYVSMDIGFLDGEVGDKLNISHVEVYDLSAKRGNSKLDISRAFDPESFDVVTGVKQFSQNDGQEVRDVFQLRGNLYVCKERSMYVTQDNGLEPSNWQVELVSSTVGTPSVHGVAVGDGWAVIASRDGLYMFDGGAPNKISQEIQPTWDTFDWTKGEQIFCMVNTAKQAIYVSGPVVGGGRQALRLSYVSGFGNPLESNGNGRAWSKDVSVPAGAMYGGGTIILDNGTKTFAIAGMGYTGAPLTTYTSIAYEDANTDLDLGVQQIYAVYETAPIGDDMGRSLFGELALKVRGVSPVIAWVMRPNAVAKSLGSKALTTDPLHDVEFRMNITDTQLGIRIESNPSLVDYPTGGYFIVKRIAVWAKPSPSAKLRGY